MSFCPIGTGGGAYPIVAQGWNDFRGFAINALNGALSQAATLASFSVEIPNPTVAFSVNEEAKPFDPPAIPKAPSVTLKIPGVLDDHKVGFIADPKFGPAPKFSETAPPVNFGGKPSPFTGTFTEEVPAATIPVVPGAPIIELPDVPTLERVIIPVAAELTLPTLSVTSPVFNAVAPGNAFNWVENLYSSANLTAIEGRVATMLSGGTGLPAAIELALFDRGRNRNDQLTIKASIESLEEWSSRGFSLPSGIVNERLRLVRQENQNKNSELNRDLTIQFHEKEIEQLNFAVVQGVALENILIQAHLAVEQRKYDALRFIVEANISLFNARVEEYNARLRGYETEVRVFVEKIKAELAKLEIFKAEIEAQKLIGDINSQAVAVYTAQVEAARTVVETYVAQLGAIRAIVDVNRTQIEAFRAKVEAFTATVNAKGAEFDAWATGVRGEVAKLEGFKYEVQAFAEEVRAYSAQNEAFRYEQTADIERERLLLSGFEAKLSNFRAKVGAEEVRVGAIAQIFDGQAKVYASAGSIAGDRAESENRRVSIEIGRETARTQVELRNTAIAASNALDASRLSVAALDGAARTYASTASAALSAVSLSASISASDSNSGSCSTNFTIETTA